MKFHHKIFFIGALVCFVLIILSANILYITPGKDFSITILHTNDTHGIVSHEPYLKTLADNKKKAGENVLLMSAGDVFHGQLIASLSKGLSILKIMNEVGCDYLAPGNHDFNFELIRVKELEAQANFKILSANITNKSDGQATFKPYDIKEIDGVKIGIFGLTTPETLVKTSGVKSVSQLNFENPIEAAKKTVAQLKSEGCKIIIAITHLGLCKSTTDLNVPSDNLARNVPDIDLIIDGHSHTVLKNGLKVGNTLIAQAGKHGENIGVVNIELKDDILSESAYLINLSEDKSIAPNQNILKIIQNENKKIEAIASEKIRTIDFDLEGERENVRKNETNLADLITDAMLSETNADLAIINGGTIRASIKSGEVTKEDIFMIMPFENLLTIQKVKGTTILEALEHGVSQYPKCFGGNVHVSGIKFKFDDKQELGQKVFDVYFTKNNEKLNPDKEYILALNEFMVDGGDGYDMFEEKKDYCEYDSMTDVLIKYIQNLDDFKIYEKMQNRIKVQKKYNTLKNISSYTVQKGDTLYKIALRFKTTWPKLAQINSIKNPDLIYPGNIIKIS